MDDEENSWILEEAAVIYWRIWLVRNNAVFDNIQPSSTDTLRRIRHLISDCQMYFWKDGSNSTDGNMRFLEQQQGWVRQCDIIIINYAVAFDEQTGKAGLVAIARNHHGTVVDVVNIRILAQNVHMAKAEVIRNAVRMAIRNGWLKVIVESNSKIVVDDLNNHKMKN